MKTKLSFVIFLFIAHLSLLTAQVPQGFNYQAVARLTTGDPIINTTLPVRITIQADSLGTLIIWQELHSSVTTNGFGAFTLVLGKGARQTASTVAAFNAIDWSITPKFIKTEIDYSGWKTMGVTRLWAVPFATVAGDLAGSVKKLSVSGQTSFNDEALFEVRNKSGQLVFAVYNEGVRIYVSDGTKGLKGGFAVGGFGTDKGISTPYFVVGKDSVRVYLDTNPLTKKLKGGFAVGGYDLTKGIVVQDYLDVNSDSVRIYIDSDPATKKLKGGFAVGGYDMTKGTNTNYMNVNTDASGVINPSQNRILWYPLKNAFLTGRVLITDSVNVGVNSFASGYESRAKGRYSQAMGFKAIANGDYSTAIGKNAVTNYINSFAFGEGATASNAESYAIGRGAIASGYRSFAFGSAGVDQSGDVTDVARALGDYSFSIGQGSRAIGKGSFAIGIADTAAGDFSMALGHRASSGGSASTAIGLYSDASGGLSTALGYQSIAKGSASTALGSYARAIENYSVAIGYETFATGFNATAIGCKAIASGWISSSIGFESNSKGTISTAMGYRTVAKGDYSTSLGSHTLAKPLSSLAIGQYNDTTCSATGSNNWISTDPLFIVGNGTFDGDLKNAFTILKNGYTAIGHASPGQMLDVNGNARFRSIGSGAYFATVNRTIDGTLTTASSDIRSKDNVQTLNNCLNSVLNLRGISFTWKSEPEMGTRIGFIAQEVEKVLPELVFTNPADGLKGVNYAEITAVLVEAIKEQQKQIDELRQIISEMRKEIASSSQALQ